MIVDIYGIDESDFRCSGCKLAKSLFDEHGIEYTFKRIIKKEEGNPIYDNDLMSELSKKIKFTTLTLPYIFIDGELVKIANLKDKLNDLGYETF